MSLEQEALVHEVGQVGDGWNRVAVETSDHHFFHKVVEVETVHTLVTGAVGVQVEGRRLDVLVGVPVTFALTPFGYYLVLVFFRILL